jgi:uncharacterized alkaline shock family protein YloU
MEDGPSRGKITIAPEVIATVARLTALATPGVARMVSPPGVRRLLGIDGVKIDVENEAVRVELHVVAEPGVSMLQIGRKVQSEVTRAIQELVGMTAQSVDVYIEDVASGWSPE